MHIRMLGELLHWSYANLAMAHAAVSSKCTKYERTHFSIRSRLYAGLRSGRMNLAPIVQDERLKMILPQACCYCGCSDHLTVDHLIPRKRGGPHAGDNLVWACRTCNSSKCATDALEWLAKRQEFPPLLLLRRYLKLAIAISEERALMNTPLNPVPDVPFTVAAIPISFPPPSMLRLWITDVV